MRLSESRTYHKNQRPELFESLELIRKRPLSWESVAQWLTEIHAKRNLCRVLVRQTVASIERGDAAT